MPVASMRLKWLRDAVDDFDFLTLATELDEAGRARAMELTRTFARGFGDWVDDVPSLLSARRELGQLLARKLATPTGTQQSASSP
jgi:hypothetical protein